MSPSTPPTGGRPSDFLPLKPSRPPEDLSKDPLLMLLPRDAEGRPMAGRIPILCRIGKGGMGAVYYAVHPRLNVEVAVKVLPPHLLDQEPKLADRFVTEARVAAALESDHVVRVLDVDRDGTTFFLVMQYVEGESAGGYLKRRQAEGAQSLTEAEALEILTAAARGLAVAHAKGIVHRDIKPDNILIPRGALSRAKLADLGLAKPEGGGASLGTQSHVAMGTPGYMAPEQIEDARSAGPAADVFSMGATLYALLSGRAPFKGTSLAVILRETATKEPEPLPAHVGPGARSIVNRCLAKDPAKRFAGGEGLLRALEEARTGLGTPSFLPESDRPTAVAPAPRRSSSWRWAGIAAFLLAGTATFFALRKDPPPPNPSVVQTTPPPVEKPAPPVVPDPPPEKPPDPPPAPPGPSEEKRAAYRGYMTAADIARMTAEAKDAPEDWRRVAEACAKAEANAQTPDETRAARDLSALASQRETWAAARSAEKAGNLDEAIALAAKAASLREAPAALSDYAASLKARKKEIEDRAARKKEFDQWAGQARAEKDPAAALALWKRAETFADGDADRDEARRHIKSLSDRVAGLEMEKRREAALKEAESLLKDGRLDDAASKFEEAARLKEGDPAAADGLARVKEARTRREYDAAMAEARDAETKKDLARAREACERALKIRPNDPEATAALARLKVRSLPDRVSLALDRNGKVLAEFVRIKAGKFMMGRPGGEGNEKLHAVTITKDFWIQTTEVTQAQWKAVMIENPSHFRGDDLPVENVSWEEALDFAGKLGELKSDEAGGGKFDLPTEAELEYASRAGATGPWCFGDDGARLGEYAWYGGNAGDMTHPVGQKKANAWGLFDVHGNVWEWCRDWYGESTGAAEDPTGPASGKYRLLRGGGWNQDLMVGHTPDRFWYDPSTRYPYVGVRLVLRPPGN